MTDRIRNFLKGKNINLVVFNSILQQEINKAIEQYKKEVDKKETAAGDADSEIITVEKETTEVENGSKSIAQAISK